MAYNDLEKTCYLHHVSRYRGYISRRGDPVIKPYKGRFGSGYTVLLPAWDSTQYCYIEYWIYK